MAFMAFNHGVNVVGMVKNKQKYCMTCAWAMQVDYDKVMLLIGKQSVTGQKIMPGDIIGISALSEFQREIALKLGDEHSDQVDKLEGIQHLDNDGAIYILNAARLMKVEVLEIMHPKGIEEDNLIYGKIIEKIETIFPFLNMSDI
ncbi:MAG: flavin reductase [Bacilli bacterium]|nr:flavin reductase [Bacilli bacterium]